MIEMLGEMIAGILGLIRKGEFKKASVKIDRIYYDMLKQPSMFFKNIPENELIVKLLNDCNYTTGHLEVLAELLNTEAELNKAEGDKAECLDNPRKSLILFEFVDKEQKTYSADRILKMDSIKSRIEAF